MPCSPKWDGEVWGNAWSDFTQTYQSSPNFVNFSQILLQIPQIGEIPLNRGNFPKFKIDGDTWPDFGEDVDAVRDVEEAPEPGSPEAG